jgi:small-conductance mechanosensitive channel
MNVGTWWSDNGDSVIFAGVSIVVALVVAHLVDRALSRRAEPALSARLSREGETRLRFVRRVVYAVILLLGVAAALSQFDGVNRIAASLLASGVVAAAIIGFAARQTLANFVAGIMLAITQPIRVGDWVTFEGNYGVVEDVSLNHTVLRTATEQRIVIPNEKLAGGVLKNDTLKIDLVALDVAVWVPPEADAARAMEVLVGEGEVAMAETVPWGVRLLVSGGMVPPADRGAGETALRARCHARLREEGLLEP